MLFHAIRAVFPGRRCPFLEKSELVILSHIFTKKSRRWENVKPWKTSHSPFLPSRRVIHLIHNRSFHILWKTQTMSRLHLMRFERNLCRSYPQKMSSYPLANLVTGDMRGFAPRSTRGHHAPGRGGCGRIAPNIKSMEKTADFLTKGSVLAMLLKRKKPHGREKHESRNDPGGISVNAFFI